MSVLLCKILSTQTIVRFNQTLLRWGVTVLGVNINAICTVGIPPQPKLVQAFKPTKKWRHLYTRKVKLQRARQLGVVYPLISRSVYQRMADQEWQEVRTCECTVCL